MSVIVSVNIQLAGAWPTNKELDERDAVMEELDRRQFGKFRGAGCGMGSMDVAYEVHSEVKALKELKEVVEQKIPKGEYTLHSEPMCLSQDAGKDKGVAKSQSRLHKPHQLQFDMGM